MNCPSSKISLFLDSFICFRLAKVPVSINACYPSAMPLFSASSTLSSRPSRSGLRHTVIILPTYYHHLHLYTDRDRCGCMHILFLLIIIILITSAILNRKRYVVMIILPYYYFEAAAAAAESQHAACCCLR